MYLRTATGRNSYHSRTKSHNKRRTKSQLFFFSFVAVKFHNELLRFAIESDTATLSSEWHNFLMMLRIQFVDKSIFFNWNHLRWNNQLKLFLGFVPVIRNLYLIVTYLSNSVCINASTSQARHIPMNWMKFTLK